MVNICADHASSTDLLFSTDPDPEKSKTMCLAFGCKDKVNLGTINYDGDALPWKDHVNHCTTLKDTLQKRASFIQTCYNLNQEFSFSNREIKLKMLRLYNTALYGSNNWKFSSEPVLKLSRSWNVNLRNLSYLSLWYSLLNCWGTLWCEVPSLGSILQLYIDWNKSPAIQGLYNVTNVTFHNHSHAFTPFRSLSQPSQPFRTFHNLSRPFSTFHKLSEPFRTFHNLSQFLT